MLTSGEVQQLLEARGQRLNEVPAAPLDSIISGIPDDPQLYGIPGGSGQISLIQHQTVSFRCIMSITSAAHVWRCFAYELYNCITLRCYFLPFSFVLASQYSTMTGGPSNHDEGCGAELQLLT